MSSEHFAFMFQPANVGPEVLRFTLRALCGAWEVPGSAVKEVDALVLGDLPADGVVRCAECNRLAECERTVFREDAPRGYEILQRSLMLRLRYARYDGNRVFAVRSGNLTATVLLYQGRGIPTYLGAS